MDSNGSATAVPEAPFDELEEHGARLISPPTSACVVVIGGLSRRESEVELALLSSRRTLSDFLLGRIADDRLNRAWKNGRCDAEKGHFKEGKKARRSRRSFDVDKRTPPSTSSNLVSPFARVIKTNISGLKPHSNTAAAARAIVSYDPFVLLAQPRVATRIPYPAQPFTATAKDGSSPSVGTTVDVWSTVAGTHRCCRLIGECSFIILCAVEYRATCGDGEWRPKHSALRSFRLRLACTLSTAACPAPTLPSDPIRIQ